MKLYTEEQVRKMLEVCIDSDLYEHILTFEDILKTETPIELPSDEEIECAKKNAWSTYEYKEGNLYSTTFNGGFELGAKFVIDKIQGGGEQ